MTEALKFKIYTIKRFSNVIKCCYLKFYAVIT